MEKPVPEAAPAFGAAPRRHTPDEIVRQAFAALGIAAAHDAAVEAEAAAWRARSGIDDPTLADLRGLDFVTIDNPGSRDLDQALHIERDGPGYRLRYALADAAHFVRPGSALFAAALARGTSHYAPGTVAPMLPRSLSEDLVSLGPGVERRAVVFDMRLDARASVLATAVLRARLRSRAQLTYGGVQGFLDGCPHPDEPIDPAWAGSLRLLHEVGERLGARARERGVIAFDRREVRIDIEGVPPRFVARERGRLDTERWNAEISLLCNMEGAALLAGFDAHDPDDAVQPIYRVHDAPLAERLRELRRRLDAWTALAGLDPRWRWRDGQALADYVDALPDDPREAGRVRAVQRQVLVLQRASEFRAEPGRHHALAVDGYARLSSPMREIVGVFTHRELLEALGVAVARAAGPDTALRDAVIASANAARRRQKSLDKAIGLAVIADLLEADLARAPVPRHAGTVLGLRAGRAGRDGASAGGAEGGGHLYVGIDALALDLKVYGADLERRHGTPYALDELHAVPADASRPVFVLGDAVDVRAAGWDASRERFALDVTPRGEAARRERRRARRG